MPGTPEVTLRVFVSSTFEDLVAHRDRVANVIERLGQQRIRMEAFGARPNSATVASLAEVAESDAAVGIYAHRYGYVPAGASESITEAEFDHAVELGVPVFCYIVDADYPWPPKQIEREPGLSNLRAFKDRVRATVVCDTFTTPDDLGFKVGAALGRFMVHHSVTAALESASQSQVVGSPAAREQVARRAERLAPLLEGARVLLVNDVPEEMRHVIRILRELGLEVVITTSTEAGLEMLAVDRFDAVVSDMRRGDTADAGTRLINAMRERGLYRPTILTPGRYQPDQGTPPFAFGITNRVDELLNLVFDTLERTRG